RWRRALELDRPLSRGGSFVVASRRMTERGERLPRRQQRRIQRHGTLVSLDGRRGPVGGPMAVPALLKETAEVGVDHLEALERCERIGDAAEVALAHSDEIQHVSVLGDLLEEATGIGER